MPHGRRSGGPFPGVGRDNGRASGKAAALGDWAVWPEKFDTCQSGNLDSFGFQVPYFAGAHASVLREKGGVERSIDADQASVTPVGWDP